MTADWDQDPLQFPENWRPHECEWLCIRMLMGLVTGRRYTRTATISSATGLASRLRTNHASQRARNRPVPVPPPIKFRTVPVVVAKMVDVEIVAMKLRMVLPFALLRGSNYLEPTLQGSSRLI